MKKNVYKTLAAAFAVALVVSSPATSITSQAYGFNADAHDDTDRGIMPDDYWASVSGTSSSTSSSSIESSQPATAPASTPAPAPKVEESGSVNSGSSSNGGSSNSGSSNSSSSNSGSSIASASVYEGSVISVEGYEKARHVKNAGAGTYQIWHMGINQYSFKVVCGESTMGYKDAGLAQLEDGRWTLNITTDASVDTTGWTIMGTKGDRTYLPKLGIMAISINGTVIVDLEEEAAAKAEAVK